ncbi:MarR family winged helix-turn-helix transcriptional regulator [Thermoflavimicrobium daqui]|jgi:DNA-binding MarR family transcriptional regulator|uniref:MarR family transcriptional regulator n=1 Tax=Thermoflavimicrobium daqui TaxID=2137476 RepID=A0A364K868_9BACL|nr:MarR family transcriptional regulator [Thermoflavimicrobium daqui]RAL26390.1 MarR family transcriptional regulator [Thermoflavimicrobium daqui]
MGKVEHCITFLLGKAYQKSQQIAKQHLNAFQITPVQYAVLLILWEKDGQYIAELGTRLKLDGATMTGIIDRLVQKNLIEKHADAKDRRINKIMLTEKGKSLENQLINAMNAGHQEILSELTETEMVTLKAILAKIGDVKR